MFEPEAPLQPVGSWSAGGISGSFSSWVAEHERKKGHMTLWCVTCVSRDNEQSAISTQSHDCPLGGGPDFRVALFNRRGIYGYRELARFTDSSHEGVEPHKCDGGFGGSWLGTGSQL